jgi:hypothetical protein
MLRQDFNILTCWLRFYHKFGYFINLYKSFMGQYFGKYYLILKHQINFNTISLDFFTSIFIIIRYKNLYKTSSLSMLFKYFIKCNK